MYLPEEFLKHAADCQEMAKSTRDPVSKASWSRMADRWLQCAEWAKTQASARSHAHTRRARRVVPNWNHI
jgi:hypothetical protein